MTLKGGSHQQQVSSSLIFSFIQQMYDPSAFINSETTSDPSNPLSSTHMTSPFFQGSNSYKTGYDYYETGTSDPNLIAQRELRPHYRDCQFDKMGPVKTPEPAGNSLPGMPFSSALEMKNALHSHFYTDQSPSHPPSSLSSVDVLTSYSRSKRGSRHRRSSSVQGSRVGSRRSSQRRL